MKMVVVGANGQLGNALSRTVTHGIEICPMDLPKLDITDAGNVDATIARESPDLIVNAAAYTAVDRAEKERDLAFAVNAEGPANLARAAETHGCRLIHVSTDYVFDGTAGSPYPDNAPCKPLGVYGRSKRQGEVNVLETAGQPLIIRTSWLYSPWGANFVLTMLKLMRSKDKLTVVADQIGSPTFAVTLAGAIRAAMDRPQLHGIYHWADAGVASWYDFAVAIQEEALAMGLLERSIPIRPIPTSAYPTRAKRPAYSVLDSSRTWSDFAMEPVHWRTALRTCLADMVRGS
ncbi:MAG: dTDP-4-dehydrorhamnose reductase [Proteobacteria bacterium]|nr:MAG: dTDP-4-dehydrorhamnose reductase [Pseudomonadota bacterium]PIE66871.1 MAG: dTDP-4-dehydrorhamnose reductase [Deltaproteobacteria bacterium]